MLMVLAGKCLAGTSDYLGGFREGGVNVVILKTEALHCHIVSTAWQLHSVMMMQSRATHDEHSTHTNMAKTACQGMVQFDALQHTCAAIRQHPKACSTCGSFGSEANALRPALTCSGRIHT